MYIETFEFNIFVSLEFSLQAWDKFVQYISSGKSETEPWHNNKVVAL